jgi:5-methylcytosine-specific restriction endonuclease McrA
MKRPRQRAQLGTVPLEDVLPLIGKLTEKGNYRHTVVSDKGESHLVKTGSHRLQLFRKNRKCVHCGVVGTHFVLEQDFNHARPHLNLYTDDGILMTKDHIIPKSKGGKNDLSNYQTMCERCNAKKADSMD